MEENDVNIRVRPIKMTDCDAVLHLGGSFITREEIISLNTDDPSNLSFVAESQAKVVGFSIAHVLYVGIPLTKICVIGGIVVDHEYRRLGIGEKLVEALAEKCRERGINTVRTLVEDGDDRLTQFVVNIGFQRSVVDNYDKIL